MRKLYLAIDLDLRFLGSALLVFLCTVPALAQQTPPASSSSGSVPEPVATFKTTSRMVTVEVVAKDHKGQPVKNLTADDFELFEQAAGWRKEKRQQKIALIKEINIAELAKQQPTNIEQVPGIFTNFVSLQKDPVPPTIMLVDALNTEWIHRAQV